jgi:hypothetical protein
MRFFRHKWLKRRMELAARLFCGLPIGSSDKIKHATGRVGKAKRAHAERVMTACGKLRGHAAPFGKLNTGFTHPTHSSKLLTAYSMGLSGNKCSRKRMDTAVTLFQRPIPQPF